MLQLVKKHNTKITLKFECSLSLNESQSRAMKALACYGIDSFLEVFYDKMGKSYLEPHEEGLRSLFEEINEQLTPDFQTIDTVWKTLRKAGL